MNNLLDTHTFLWYIEGNESLSAKAKAEIEMENAVNYVSIISIWEISIKISLGKLQPNTSFNSLAYFIAYNGFNLLPISFADTVIITALPFHHKDPFDRMLIAQALGNNLQLITKDEKFGDYGVSLLW